MCLRAKSDTSHTNDDDEADAISDDQLFSNIVGEVSEVGLDDVMLGPCYELKATKHKSRASSIKKALGLIKRLSFQNLIMFSNEWYV
jgi:hypothetical protein